MASNAPSAELITYQVGFGDCFVLRFTYPGGKRRHVLIDFGAMPPPKDAAPNHMLQIAQQIKEDCGGKLDVVVATHRHKDHISGFATSKPGDSGDIIRSCKPQVVLQPWTEHPNAKEDATDAPLRGIKSFRRTLDSMHAVAEASVAFADSWKEKQKKHFGGREPSRIGLLRFTGEDNVKNLAAVKNLMTMSPERLYLKHGDKVPLGKILPGVKIHVLGPPSLKQSDSIRKQVSKHEEFWMLANIFWSTAERDAQGALSRSGPRGHGSSEIPVHARWFAGRLTSVSAELMLSIVTALDKQMNNTSLILLFEVGGKYLLFPGDAQIENWQYALSRPNVEALLKKVDVYKVGHHGSRNATPRSLWALLTGNKAKADLKTFMSTMDGVHGHTAATRVPRDTLVKEFDAKSQLTDTRHFKKNEKARSVAL